MRKFDGLSLQELEQLDISNMQIDDFDAFIKAKAVQGKKWCYDCKYFYYDCFCGYKSCNCGIYGSLDMDQIERSPDKTADTCKDYIQKSDKRWFEKEDSND